jgi:tetratricopeptide (TPR) repeat protein
LPVAHLDVTPQISLAAPVLGQPTDFDLRYSLAILLSGKSSTLAEAEHRLAALSAAYPERPETEEALGTLAFQSGRKDDARYHLGLAVHRHSKSAEAIYQYAVLRLDAGATNNEVTALLRHSLELEPGLDEARIELAFLDEQDVDYESSLSLLLGLKAVPRGAEFQVHLTMAQCYFNLNRYQDARTYGKKAEMEAGNEKEKREAADVLTSIDDEAGEAVAPAGASQEAAPQPVPALTSVWGSPKALECENGQKRLRVEVDGREMVFDVNDPNLVVRNAKQEFSQWACGALKLPNLTVVYTPEVGETDGKKKILNGKVRELVF